MIDGNTFLNDLIGKNWMVLMLIYVILNNIFPDSKILQAIGKGFSNMFPVFKRKE